MNGSKPYLSKTFLACAAVISLLGACTKASSPYYASGKYPLLQTTTTTVALTATDSLNTAFVLSWSDPKYPTPFPGPALFTIQIDSAGHNFLQPTILTVSGSLLDSMTAKQINTLVLGMGGTYNVPYTIEARVISSYSNNNDQLTSNTITIKVTPYVTPPKVTPPAGNQLFLVGNATQGGWSNPVPVPTQQFEKVDSVDYAGVFNLIGGNQYLVLPVNGDWTNKYATNDVNPAATGGTFGYNASNNFTGPLTSGWYTIWLSFQAGTVTVTPYSGAVPDSLYIVGAATAGGWNNPVPVPSQQLTQLNSSQFSVQLPLSAAGQYLLLPVNGSWTNKYAVNSSNDTVSGGTFGYNLSTNFTGPANAGTYTMTFDFLTWTYIVK
jgi:starch-binding outer membrane protein SusE/F